MATTFQNSLKAKLQQVSSPKVKLGGQSPSFTNFQRIPTNGKVSYREINKSQSPEDQNSQRNGTTQIQRIQMKNVAFIPAKGQSPISTNIKLQQNVPNLTNMNGQEQFGKISPQRATGNVNKMIIPANQIKLVKKDGTSPSPEARQSSKIGNQNQQNINPNILTGGYLNRDSNHNKTSRQLNNKEHTSQHEDETTVYSDSEDKTQNLNFLKQDPSTINFNRPKLNNIQLQQQDKQKPQTQQTNRVKIISQNKIRQSPSPPPNQAIKFQQAQVMNVQIQAKEQTQQPQLATDFIKGMINQSRGNILTNNNQKKIGITNGLKVKNEQQQNKQNFVKDMKKHGIIKDIQDVNQLSQMLSETSPERQEEKQNQYQNVPNFHQRNYSPPPNFSQATTTNIQKIPTKENNITIDSQKQIAEQPSPSQEKMNEENNGVQNQDGQSVFQFPFQRRARSLSLPKQEIIQSKLQQKQQEQQQQHMPQQQQQQQAKSPSPADESRRNRPVVAKINFVIAQKGVLGQKDEEEEAAFERNKEVDEWLMGSGESANTAGSNNSNPLQTNNKIQQSLLPMQPGTKKDEDDDDNSAANDDEEDWMFKTFNTKKQQKNQTERQKQQQVIRSRINDQNFEDILGEDSPFDMAPEMSKVMYNDNKTNLLLDHIASECNDISQYIDKIDQYLEKRQ